MLKDLIIGKKAVIPASRNLLIAKWVFKRETIINNIIQTLPYKEEVISWALHVDSQLLYNKKKATAIGHDISIAQYY